jgi:hypothetical protein
MERTQSKGSRSQTSLTGRENTIIKKEILGLAERDEPRAADASAEIVAASTGPCRSERHAYVVAQSWRPNTRAALVRREDKLMAATPRGRTREIERTNTVVKRMKKMDERVDESVNERVDE